MTEGTELEKQTKLAKRALAMLYHDACEMAGTFHGMQRSNKFRAQWPDERRFAEWNWKCFVVATRRLYCSALTCPDIPDETKELMHMALVIERAIGFGKESDNTLQILPDSQQFYGDKHENKKISRLFGDHPGFPSEAVH